MRERLQWAISTVDSWFTAPEANAAGRMGLYRVLFGLFYLWHLSLFDLSILQGMPEDFRIHRMAILDGFQALRFNPADGAGVLDRILVAAIGLLVIGWRVRLVTAVVLAAGVVREALLAQMGLEDGNTFLVFYVPLFMLVVGRWGDTYSIDAAFRRRRKQPTVDATDSCGSHLVAARALLVIVAALFTTSPLFKILDGGTWISEHNLFTELALQRSVKGYVLGFPPNPLTPWLIAHPLAGYALQLGVLCFEGLFFLALFGTRLRNLFLSMAMVFHSINAIVLLVSFGPILVVYGLFVNWTSVFRRLCPRITVPTLPPVALLTGGLAAVIVLAATWDIGARAWFNMAGLLTWRSIWYLVLPLAVAASAVALVHLVRGADLDAGREPFTSPR